MQILDEVVICATISDRGKVFMLAIGYLAVFLLNQMCYYTKVPYLQSNPAWNMKQKGRQWTSKDCTSLLLRLIFGAGSVEFAFKWS